MAYVSPEDFRTGTLQWYTAGLALTTGEAGDTMIESCALRAKEIIDRHTGDEFESTEETIIVSGEGTTILRVPRRIQNITSVSYLAADGTWVEVDEQNYVVNASLDEDGATRVSDVDYIATAYGRDLIPPSTAWPQGLQNISVEGTFGWSVVPEGIKRASALIVYDLLKPRNNDLLRRADSYQTDDASFTVSKSTPTGLPEVDSILIEYAYPRVF